MIGYRQGHITTMMGRFPSIFIITAEGYYNTLGLITGGFGAGLDHIIIFLKVIIIQIGPHYRWLWAGLDHIIMLLRVIIILVVAESQVPGSI
jgi:hypothetical protein